MQFLILFHQNACDDDSLRLSTNYPEVVTNYPEVVINYPEVVDTRLPQNPSVVT